MSMFQEQAPHPTPAAAPTPPTPEPGKRPARFSPSNWSVRWKVLLIVLIPTAFAVAFGGVSVYDSVTDATDLRRTADRAELVRPVEQYMAALDNALLAYTTDGDVTAARSAFDESRARLQTRTAESDLAPDVRAGVNTILDGSGKLIDGVASDSVGLADRVKAYVPILLTAQDVINGSVRADDDVVRAQALGLSRAVGARGQMLLQKLLVDRGGELPEPELRSSMSTVAGTEPSTVSGMTQVLGVSSPDAKNLQEQLVTRMAIISNPAIPLPGNADLVTSLETTDTIARKVIDQTSTTVLTAVDEQASAARNAAIRDAAIVLAALLVALLLVFVAARALVRPLQRLRAAALRVAHEDLPAEIARVQAGDEPPPIELIPVHTTEEIGQLAHAVDELHEQALLLASDQARLQSQVSDMFETLSRRNRSLVDQQLALIDDLERNEDDPRRLDALFKLDHLAARMRRNGANLLVLSGAQVRREQAAPVPAGSIVNAAVSQVEDYRRVIADKAPNSSVVGAAAADLVHLLAEIVDNALRYSPPTENVRIAVYATVHGELAFEIVDSGLGMTDGDLRMANTRMASGGDLTPFTARHMGLFVVGVLARQHGMAVQMRSTNPGDPRSGTTVSVLVRPELIAQPTGRRQTSGARPQAPQATEAPVKLEKSSTAMLHSDTGLFSQPYANGTSDLPTRSPGASGIVDRPVVPEPVAKRTPADTSAFFTKREREQADVSPAEPPKRQYSPMHDTDVIFQLLVSESLVHPSDLMEPMQSWESVWDNGWIAAARAEDAPVEERTPDGLPLRRPGARLVPGSLDQTPSGRPNGAHRRADDDGAASIGERPIQRDPEAVRASLASHLHGVRAGRSRARHERPERQEGEDQ